MLRSLPAGFGRILGLSILTLGIISPLHAVQETDEVPVLRAEVPNDEAAVGEGPAPALLPPGPEMQRAIAPAARQPAGSLSGRIIYMSAGHGWTANQDDSGTLNGVWYTQRGDNNEIVEDLGNIDQMTMYAFYCFNAGATVVTFRPVGYQTNEVVIDNDDAGAVFTPDVSWGNSTNAQYYGGASDPVHYRFATGAAAESATARYTPNIPEEGFYPVYAWTRDGSDRVEDQLYRIVHSGGTTEVRANHRRTGKFWIYLGTYYFETGTGSHVEISNQSNDASAGSRVVIADAIRFGNGMGDINRGGGISGKSREDEASRYWVQSEIGQGASSTIYDSSSSDQNDNVSAPPRMATWMNREAEGELYDRIFLSFHSNASPGTIGLYNGNNDPNTATPNQFRWAELIGRECNDDLVAIGSPPLEGPWLDQGPNPGDVTLDRTDIEFGEINNYRINDEYDATINEVAGHVGGFDPVNLRNPNVRNWLARASYQATVRYFNEFDVDAVDPPTPSLTFLPEPPTNVRAISNGDGTVTVSWDASLVDGIGGSAATGYVVYESTNGYGFGNPLVVGNVTSAVVVPTANQAAYYRVAATNAGGESLPSETVGARALPSGPSPVLIVNGFDRFDRTLNPRETAGSGLGGPAGSGGTYDRVKPRLSNSFDYVVQVGDSVSAFGHPFDSCQNDNIISGAVNLSSYDCVLWILGEESTVDETFSATEQTAVTNYLNAGGNLFMSGAEIGWDLDQQGSGSDQAFFNGLIHADYAGDDANTYTVNSSAGSIFNGNGSLAFDDGTSGQYNAEFPDQLSIPTSPNNTGVAVGMTYSGGSGGNAALVYDGTGTTTGKVVILGFPLETILSEADRDEIIADVLAFFGTSVPVELSGFTVR